MNDRDALSQIADLPEPRHLFVLPAWLDPAALDRLIDQGCVTCAHLQRNENGVLQVVMDIRLTPKGLRAIQTQRDWPNLALKGSLAGASLTAMSLLILYLG